MPAFIIQSQLTPPDADPPEGRRQQDSMVWAAGRLIGPFETVAQAESWCEEALSTGALHNTREFIVEAREIGYSIDAGLEV